MTSRIIGLCVQLLVLLAAAIFLLVIRQTSTMNSDGADNVLLGTLLMGLALSGVTVTQLVTQIRAPRRAIQPRRPATLAPIRREGDDDSPTARMRRAVAADRRR